MLKASRAALALMLTACAVPAWAQAPTTTVEGGPRVEGYQPLGTRVGSFAILPSVVVAGVYDSNVFAQKRRQQDDYILDVRPELLVKSNWTRHALEFKASGQVLEYDRFTTESQGNYFFGGNGTYEIASDMRLVGYVSFSHSHEARGSGNTFSLYDHPVAFDRLEGGASLYKAFNRLWTQIGGTARDDHYYSTKLNGVIVDQSYRNALQTEVVNRTGYEVSPKTSLFVESAYGWRSYEGTSFNNEGFRVLAGIQMEASRLLRGEVSGGWMSYHAEHSGTVGNIETYNYRARVIWEPTRLMTVLLNGGRDVGVSAEGGRSLTVTSDVGVKVDYELLRNLILSGRLGYQLTEYQASTRRDETWKAEALTEYLLSRNWSVLASYAYTDFLSTDSTLNYDKHVVSLGLRARY